MKKNTFVLFALLSLTITGCRKFYDQYIPNPKIAANLCTISQMKVYDEGRSGTYTLHYDQKGNLTSMILDHFVSSQENYYFQYDSKNRLINFQETAVEDVYTYFPDKIMDTTYFYGRLEKRWAELKTDVHGRIIKETSFIRNPLQIRRTYQ